MPFFSDDEDDGSIHDLSRAPTLEEGSRRASVAHTFASSGNSSRLSGPLSVSLNNLSRSRRWSTDSLANGGGSSSMNLSLPGGGNNSQSRSRRFSSDSGSTNGPGGSSSIAFIEADAPPHHRIFFSPDLKQQHNKLRKLASYPTDLRILPPVTQSSQRRLSSPTEAKISSLQSQRRLSAPLDQRRRVEFDTSTRFSSSPEPGSIAGNFYHESETSLQDSVMEAIISGDFMPNDGDDDDDDNEDNLGGSERGKNANRRRTESSASGMSVDVPSDSSPQDDGTTTHLDESCRPPSTQCCGQHVPLWCPKLPPVDRIAVAVAQFAPCFLLCPLKTVTDRAVLGRLNVLLAIFSVFPIVAATFFSMILYNPHIVDRTLPVQWNSPPTHSGIDFYVVSWNLNATEMLAGVVSVVIFVSNLLTARVVRDVNLVGANRYWIALNWVLPFLGFAAIALFDYFDVTNVWIIHWWREPIMAWFRRRYCVPGTFTTLCTVPQSTNETEWCLVNYNATNCAALRDEAQYKTNAAILIVFYLTAICSIFLLIMVRGERLAQCHTEMKPFRRLLISPFFVFFSPPDFACPQYIGTHHDQANRCQTKEKCNSLPRHITNGGMLWTGGDVCLYRTISSECWHHYANALYRAIIFSDGR